MKWDLSRCAVVDYILEIERAKFDGKLASNSHFDKANVPYKAAQAHPEHGGMYIGQCTILRVKLIKGDTFDSLG